MVRPPAVGDRAARRERQVGIEPLFAEVKDWPGWRRCRWRGLDPVNGAVLLIAAGQHRKRVLSRWGWGRRPWPNGAAGVVLTTARLRARDAEPGTAGDAARRPEPPRNPVAPFSTPGPLSAT